MHVPYGLAKQINPPEIQRQRHVVQLPSECSYPWTRVLQYCMGSAKYFRSYSFRTFLAKYRCLKNDFKSYKIPAVQNI